jgi:hypothetical protein
MKKLISFSLLLFAAFSLSSQVQNPVSWKAEYHQLNATEGEIIIHATIEKNWHTYSQKVTSDGPVPTSFSFTPKGYELVGKVEESEAHEEFVPAFDAKIFVYTDKAEFKQKVKLTSKSPVTASFKVEYMSCNDKMCLPPKTVDLSVKLQ